MNHKETVTSLLAESGKLTKKVTRNFLKQPVVNQEQGFTVFCSFAVCRMPNLLANMHVWSKSSKAKELAWKRLKHFHHSEISVKIRELYKEAVLKNITHPVSESDKLCSTYFASGESLLLFAFITMYEINLHSFLTVYKKYCKTCDVKNFEIFSIYKNARNSFKGSFEEALYEEAAYYIAQHPEGSDAVGSIMVKIFNKASKFYEIFLQECFKNTFIE